MLRRLILVGALAGSLLPGFMPARLATAADLDGSYWCLDWGSTRERLGDISATLYWRTCIDNFSSILAEEIASDGAVAVCVDAPLVLPTPPPPGWFRLVCEKYQPEELDRAIRRGYRVCVVTENRYGLNQRNEWHSWMEVGCVPAAQWKDAFDL